VGSDPDADRRTILEQIVKKQDDRGVDWVDLVQDRVTLTSCGTISFSRRILLHAVLQLLS
jgi:hypothetical protein